VAKARDQTNGFLHAKLVSSQKLGAEKTDHSNESRPEAPSFPDDQGFQTTLPQNIEKIRKETGKSILAAKGHFLAAV
jgi:hypothetical protein